MKILDKYIAKQILLSIFSVLGVLVVVVGVLDLVDEIKKVNDGYSLTLAFLYVFLNNVYFCFFFANIYDNLRQTIKILRQKIQRSGGCL